MSLLLPIAIAVLVSSFAVHMWHQESKRRGLPEGRWADAHNSPGSSSGVHSREDRERWGDIDLEELHPLNRDEVRRLLDLLDADGAGSLSARDRLFLDNMTLPPLST